MKLLTKYFLVIFLVALNFCFISDGFNLLSMANTVANWVGIGLLTLSPISIATGVWIFKKI